MTNEKFNVVERPLVNYRSPRTQAIRETLQNGKAVAVPINGETYAVTRNRLAASGQSAAKKLKARLCTRKSDDGTAVLIWLEPKGVSQS